MKFSILIISALLTSLFLLSFKASALYATSLYATSLQANTLSVESSSFLHCALISDQACGSINKQTSTTSAANIPANTDQNTAQSMRFSGVFTNTDLHVSGLITIDLTINANDTIEGKVDFSQFTSGQFVCGSGDFEGVKSGEEIELHFISNDANPACGFYQGVTFTIKAALLNNTILRGDYSTDTGNKGIVELRRIQSPIGLFLPLIRP